METRLIERYDEPARSLIINQETDETTALTRGLAEYLGQLESDWPGVGPVRFARSTDTWADYEDQGEAVGYPRAFVGAGGDAGTYDGGLGEGTLRGVVLGGEPLPSSGGIILESVEELTARLVVEIDCSNPELRRAVCAMLTPAFRPYRGKTGFILELPHYFNVRASFTAMTVQFLDNEEDAARNYRKARYMIQSRLPVVVARRSRPVRAILRSSTVTDRDEPRTTPPTVERGLP